MHPDNYESEEPVDSGTVMVALGALQEEWDDYESAREEAAGKAKVAKASRERIGDKLRKLVRAADNGEPLFALVDGNLTTEPPHVEEDEGPTLFDEKVEEPEVHGESEDAEEAEEADEVGAI